MADVIPSFLGGGLERGTRAILEGILARRDRELQSRQLDLQERQVTSNERAAALDRILKLAPFMPNGATIADFPQIHPELKAAFPDFDPGDPGSLGGLVLNPETFQTAMDTLLVDALADIDPEQAASISERARNFAVFGQPVMDNDLQALSQPHQIRLSAYRQLEQDPEALDAIYRRSMDLEPVTSVQLPDGRVVRFDSAVGANLSIELLKHKSILDMEWRKLSTTQQKDLAGELMTQMQLQDIALGRPLATAIVRAYDQTMASDNPDDPNSPLNQLIARSTENGDEAALAAIDTFLGAASYADEQRLNFLTSSPGGQQTLNTVNLMSTLSEAGVPSENLLDLTSSILSNHPEIGVSFQDRPFSPPRFILTTPQVVRPQTAVPDAISGAAPETVETDLGTMMRADAAAVAAGTMSVSAVRQKYAGNPEAIRAILQSSRRPGGSGGR